MAGFIVLGVIFFLSPATSRFFPPCLFHQCTGLYCPGCGSTRMIHSLLHGDIRAAFGYNPLLLLCLPLVVICGLDWVKLHLTKKPMFAFLKSPLLVWSLAVAVIVFAILRNIPAEPFTFLAPG